MKNYALCLYLVLKKNKLRYLMKLSLFLPLLISTQLYAVSGFSQAAKVKLNTRSEISLEQLINEIEKQTEYLFIYSKNEVSLTTKVKVTAKNEPVNKILDQALANTNISYELSNNYITLKKSEKLQATQQTPTSHAKGKVIDAQGQELIGVAVTVKETNVGVITGLDGYYIINAKAGQTLKFSYIGFKTQEVKIPASLTVDVVMNEDVSELDEVVVVGMGKQRKASVIGAISGINISELKTPSRSLSTGLAGRLAGIVAVQRSGEPGYDNASFWIRGISTFGANQTPLVLVDGVERFMDNLDPEEVESVSILKDASATAVYGVRAANGVVLVTTRKGEASAKPAIELKMETGISQLTRMPKLLDGVNFMQLYNEAAGQEFYSAQRIEDTKNGVDPYLNPNINWFDEMFKDNATNSVVSLNVRGGGQVARYFISFGVLSETGNFRDNPENDYKSNISLQRYNFRTNVDVSVTKSTVLDIELGGYLIDSHYPGESTGELFSKAYMGNPVNYPLRYPMGTNPDGSTKYVWAGGGSDSQANPYERLVGSGFQTEYRTQIMGQVRLTQDFDKLVQGLKANVAFSFDSYNNTNVQRRKKDSYYQASGRNPETGELELTETKVGDEFLGYDKQLGSNRAIELKVQLNYDRVFANVHRVGAMAQYYQRDYKDGNVDTAIKSLPYRKQGVAFRATYSYDDRYFAEFNLGYNGSENFPKNQRFGTFPAGAAGYLISNEKFWKNSSISNIINLLKIKGSLGLVGAEALHGSDRFAYLTTVGGGLGGYHFGDRSWYEGTGESQYGVQNLTWEKGLKSNIGVQAEFWDGMLSLELDYFHEKRTDILVKRSALPGIVGVPVMPYANIGEMKNQGLDGTLEVRHTFGKVFTRVYGNATYTKNKILEQDEPDWKYTYQNKTGKKLDQQFGLIALGYFKDEEEIKNSAKQTFTPNVRPGDIKYLDVNGDGLIDSYDRVAIGYSSIPEVVYGFGFQLGYKGFDLGVFFRGQARVSYMMGGEGFVPFEQGGTRGNLFEEALDRWTPENPSQNAFYPRLDIGKNENNYQESTHWMYDGSFLRLADLEFGYSFPKKTIAPLHLSGLRIYFHGSNLALFSGFKMWDPEVGKGRGDAYPMQRKMNIGLRVNF